MIGLVGSLGAALAMLGIWLALWGCRNTYVLALLVSGAMLVVAFMVWTGALPNPPG